MYNSDTGLYGIGQRGKNKYTVNSRRKLEMEIKGGRTYRRFMQNDKGNNTKIREIKYNAIKNKTVLDARFRFFMDTLIQHFLSFPHSMNTFF